ncbi:MAG: endonuclease Q family protein [Omnitrophica bacterium]|nr:endonuclease Q family protein [Candidatus Omnitrophota bacterium]
MFIADFHIHSRYSRATSKDMNMDNLSAWAKVKGINLLGTGDFTHPDWLVELKSKLKESEYGIYKHDNVFYILTCEVCNIYFKSGRTRKIHNIIFSPSLETVDKINKFLSQYGKLYADGRPILSIEADRMVAGLAKIDGDIFVVPAHIWTPHFSLFGANSGFDSIEECFGEFTSRIYSLETGLSSDPGMNRRWSALDRFALISNSDAHSPSKLGREANVFREKFDYKELIEILKTKDEEKFLYTVEFYPEEGKYHWDGHRKCNALLSPEESKNLNHKCPTCGAKVTVGVMSRVEELSDKEDGARPQKSSSYKSLVPLIEIVSSALKVGRESKQVAREYNLLIKKFGSEFGLLLNAEEKKIEKECPPKIACGILNVRKGKVDIVPGYDGVYGKVNIYKETDEKPEKQLELF